MAIPDWQLPPGVDRGLWDYLHATDMVAAYDEQVESSALASADVAFCERAFPSPGSLVDLGCGTGRLCRHFAAKGYECVGVDLSEEMLAKAKSLASRGVYPRGLEFVKANLVELTELPDASFDYAACLFSTLGMVRGAENRARVVANAFRLLKPGGHFVLHVHNRFFGGLGWKRVVAQRLKTLLGSATAGEITMPQAYGGAPLTLHHFTFGEAWRLLGAAGFRKKAYQAVSDKDHRPGERWVGGRYGYLFWCQRPV